MDESTNVKITKKKKKRLHLIARPFPSQPAPSPPADSGGGGGGVTPTPSPSSLPTSNHSRAKAVTTRAQSRTVGRSRCSPSSSRVCQTWGKGEAMRWSTGTPRRRNGIWSSSTPERRNSEGFFSASRRKRPDPEATSVSSSPNPRSRSSARAIAWYAQCVVRKYEGTEAPADPSRSSSTNRLIWPSGLRYVDSAGLTAVSHSSASDLIY